MSTLKVVAKEETSTKSSRLDVDFAELHNPLFLAGTNLGLKLDMHKRQGVRLEFCRNSRFLLVHFNNKVAMIPESNISSMTPKNVEDVG